MYNYRARESYIYLRVPVYRDQDPTPQHLHHPALSLRNPSDTLTDNIACQKKKTSLHPAKNSIPSNTISPPTNSEAVTVVSLPEPAQVYLVVLPKYVQGRYNCSCQVPGYLLCTRDNILLIKTPIYSYGLDIYTLFSLRCMYLIISSIS